ncbi:MAG TPA: serine hydrolase [Actinomycetota bacterium]|jgi:CubicO group peptidase (beta-lactamase class C family)|nr:serine hydrolase [Actinomycetota bacterium]
MRHIQRLSHLSIAAALVIAGVVATTLPAQAGPASCGVPKSSWTARAPARLGLDPEKLQEALDFATTHSSETVLVFRRGCLAGASRLDPVTSELTIDGWSMTKSVTALLVGRAVTLGRLNIDRPIGPLFPEADQAHARITPRNLMQMSSGLHRHWMRDYHGPSLHPDRVRDALSLPFDHKPGTVWEYHQSAVTLLGEAVARAVGRDLQDFAQRELFTPIGIAPGTWTWDRDRAGNSEAWAHLHMRSSDWARLGTLVLHGGRWGGRLLISKAYMRQFSTSAPTNRAYGFLTWLNGKDSYVLPGPNGRDRGKGWVTVNAPRDAIIFAGQDEQRIYVIPSLDMVVVRLGQKASRELDFRVTFWSGRSGEFDNGFMLRLKKAVTDRKLDTTDHYRSAGLVLPSTERDSWEGSAVYEPVELLAAVGAGPHAPEGCTPAGCD